MRYTDGENTVEAFKWNGNVLAGTEKGAPGWLGEAITVTHRIWFDAAWNMKVETAAGPAVCGIGDYIVRDRDGSLDIVQHDEFKERYSKVR